MRSIWGKVTVGGTGLAITAFQPVLLSWVALLALLVLLGVVVGVILPAVWSKNPGRQKAAKAVLRMLLSAVRRSQ